MKKYRVMLLVHSTLVPPDDLQSQKDPRIEKYQTEFDVKTALISLGHDVKVVGIYDDLAPMRQTIEAWSPDIAFNLLEEFDGNTAFDYYVVSYLEMMKIPYTGCNPRGLLLARDKALSKKILNYHRIKTPEFVVFPKGKKVRRKKHRQFPLIIKPLTEEGSKGISQASLVDNDEQLRERVDFIHENILTDAIAEQFIDGRELYVTITGNSRLNVLPFRELTFKNTDDNKQNLATYRVKWNKNYRQRHGIQYQHANNLPEGMSDKIFTICKRAYKILEINGYARLDLRLGNDGKVYILEVNPNPAIAHNDDCAQSADKAGINYPGFIQRIINLGMRANHH